MCVCVRVHSIRGRHYKKQSNKATQHKKTHRTQTHTHTRTDNTKRKQKINDQTTRNDIHIKEQANH